MSQPSTIISELDATIFVMEYRTRCSDISTQCATVVGMCECLRSSKAVVYLLRMVG